MAAGAPEAAAAMTPLMRQYAGFVANGLPPSSFPSVQSLLHHWPTMTFAVRSTQGAVVQSSGSAGFRYGFAGTFVQLAVLPAFICG